MLLLLSACSHETTSSSDMGTLDADEVDANDMAPDPVPRYPGPCQTTISDGPDSPPEARTTFTYDEEGRLLVDAFDFDLDGTPDTVTSRTYDASGNLVRWERDRPIGPPVERVVLYEYDVRGRYLRIERAENGLLVLETYTWTDDHTATVEIDSGTDGTVDFTGTRANEYDDAGNHLRSSWDLDSDGAIEEEWRQTFEADKLVRRETYINGELSAVVLYEYDDAGNLVTERTDYEGDGVYDEQTTYTYDAAGNILTTQHQSPITTPDAMTTLTEFDYSCWDG